MIIKKSPPVTPLQSSTPSKPKSKGGRPKKAVVAINRRKRTMKSKLGAPISKSPTAELLPDTTGTAYTTPISALPSNDITRHPSHLCQHPRTNTPGFCTSPHIGSFPVHDSYVPEMRHRIPYLIPRPTANLCRVHRGLVHFNSLGVTYSGLAHELGCDVCYNPRHLDILNDWLNWRITTPDTATELGVSRNSLNRHLKHFDLHSKRADKDNRAQAYGIIVEKGLAKDDHSVKHAIAALKELGVIKGDVIQKSQLEVTGNVMVGKVDLTSLSSEKLVEMMTALAAQIAASESGQGVITGGEGEVMDLPETAVRVVNDEEETES